MPYRRMKGRFDAGGWCGVDDEDGAEGCVCSGVACGATTLTGGVGDEDVADGVCSGVTCGATSAVETEDS